MPGKEDNIWIQLVKIGDLLLKIYKSVKNFLIKNHVLGEISQNSTCDEKKMIYTRILIEPSHLVVCFRQHKVNLNHKITCPRLVVKIN